jgi:hypothetical protein
MQTAKESESPLEALAAVLQEQVPGQDHLPWLVYLEQKCRQEGNLEFLRAIKVHREFLLSMRKPPPV